MPFITSDLTETFKLAEHVAPSDVKSSMSAEDVSWVRRAKKPGVTIDKRSSGAILHSNYYCPQTALGDYVTRETLIDYVHMDFALEPPGMIQGKEGRSEQSEQGSRSIYFEEASHEVQQAYQERMRRDQAWFETNWARLRRELGAKYVAVLHEQVLDYDKDEGRLLERTWQRKGLCSFYLGYLGSAKRPENQGDSHLADWMRHRAVDI